MRLTRCILSLLLAFLLFVPALTPASAQSDFDPATYEWLVAKVYTPEGFDDNDTAMVVFDGFLENSCDIPLEPEREILPDFGTIVVKTQARRGWCADGEAVSFHQEVALGILPTGDYDISVNGNRLIEPLAIAESDNAGPDDFRYAAVASADVVMRRDGVWQAELLLVLTNSCEQVAEVIVTDHAAAGGTIEVLPTLDWVDAEECWPVENPQWVFAPLPEMPQAGRYLLHVRAKEGEALNTLFNVPE